MIKYYPCLLLLIAISCSSPEKPSDNIETPKDTPDTTIIEKVDAEVITELTTAKSNPSDTLRYLIQSDSTEIEPYKQSLKILQLTDTTIWFRIFFEDVIGSGEIEGTAVDKFSKIGLEIDEYQGSAYTAKEFIYEEGEFYYAIRINVADSSLAKINTSSEVHTDLIPLDLIMERVK